MKKYVALMLVLCLYLSGCNLVPGNVQQVGETQNVIQDNKNATTQSTLNNSDAQDKDTAIKDTNANVPGMENIKNQNEANNSNEASVETLVRLEEDFIDAAFAGDVDDMIGLSSNSMADDIEKNPKKYIGTKTDYKIDKVDTTIRPLGQGKYQLTSVVSAEKKDTKEKKVYDFKYSATVEKVKGDYYMIDFKRDSK